MKALPQLIHELGKLPGIGNKTAMRLAYFLLNADGDYVSRLSSAMTQAKANVRNCSVCYNYTEDDLCDICTNPSRVDHQIAIVERPSDVEAVLSTASFSGKFHVLHGLISPVDGTGPEEVHLNEFRARVAELAETNTVEIMLALNPSVESEATALYIARVLQGLSVEITKIAYGLPMGGALEYADKMTIAKAISNRVTVQN